MRNDASHDYPSKALAQEEGMKFEVRNNPQQPEETPAEIPHMLRMVQKEVSEAQGVFANLVGKIHPVLTESYPRTEGDTSSTYVVESTVGSELMLIYNEVVALRDHMLEISGRVAL